MKCGRCLTPQCSQPGTRAISGEEGHPGPVGRAPSPPNNHLGSEQGSRTSVYSVHIHFNDLGWEMNERSSLDLSVCLKRLPILYIVHRALVKNRTFIKGIGHPLSNSSFERFTYLGLVL